MPVGDALAGIRAWLRAIFRRGTDGTAMGVDPYAHVTASETHPEGGAATPEGFPALRWASLVVGLLLVGAALSYLFAPPVAAPEKVVTIQGGAASADEASQARQGMPSVTGLSLETLRAVMRDAGAADVEIVTKSAPAPGPAGRITAQDPAAGAPITERVTVTTSSPLTMPDVTGKDFTAVRADLQGQGAVVRATPVIKPGAKIGTVLASVPAAGENVPTVVTLSVADPGQALSLSDLDDTDASECYGSRSITFGNQSDLTGITCSLSGEGETYAEYALDGNALSFAFTLGFDADAGRGSATVRVLGDGKQMASVQVSEKPQQQRIDVTDVRTLRIEVTGNATAVDNPPIIAFGDAVLQGRPDQIDALAGQ